MMTSDSSSRSILSSSVSSFTFSYMSLTILAQGRNFSIFVEFFELTLFPLLVWSFTTDRTRIISPSRMQRLPPNLSLGRVKNQSSCEESLILNSSVCSSFSKILRTFTNKSISLPFCSSCARVSSFECVVSCITELLLKYLIAHFRKALSIGLCIPKSSV